MKRKKKLILKFKEIKRCLSNLSSKQNVRKHEKKESMDKHFIHLELQEFQNQRKTTVRPQQKITKFQKAKLGKSFPSFTINILNI